MSLLLLFLFPARVYVTGFPSLFVLLLALRLIVVATALAILIQAQLLEMLSHDLRDPVSRNRLIELHHVRKARDLADAGGAEAALADLLHAFGISPAGVIRSDPDVGVLLVPRREMRVGLGFDGAEGAGNKGENAGDAGPSVAGGEELLDADIGVADADEDNAVGVIEADVVVPEVAQEFLALALDRIGISSAGLGEGSVEGSSVGAVGYVEGNVDVDDGKTVVTSPFNIRADGVIL